MYRRIVNNYFQQRNQPNPARVIQPNPSRMQSDQPNLSDFQVHQFNSSHAPHPNFIPQYQQKPLAAIRRSSRVTKIHERFRETN